MGAAALVTTPVEDGEAELLEGVETELVLFAGTPEELGSVVGDEVVVEEYVEESVGSDVVLVALDGILSKQEQPDPRTTKTVYPLFAQSSEHPPRELNVDLCSSRAPKA
ncbi:hypothetical protein DHEL01_v211076 [Diaporthe helianthi]|uniref:Uncharacterized protein n=1 Tax=Diaporthe helianthi TaxID=158607 RepID=A0A2P5HJU5_DIAHE|nr:hypothetical protein DHEL01_v211076 [Diaporthe helianthi]